MSRKRILNVASRKKRNGMLQVTNATYATGVGGNTVITQPMVVNAGSGAWVLWAATAQDLTDGNNGAGTVTQVAQRTSTNCYMRGLSEHIRIQTSSATPWFWRRTVFRLKGNSAFQTYASSPAGMSGLGPYYDSSSGIQRLLLNSNSQTVSQASTVTAQQTFLFKGVSGVDWSDPIIAPLDTSRISVMYDKTSTLRSGNQSGTVRECKLWHPMNKSLVYDDDENGSLESSSFFSTTAKPGMGDVYVLDQFAGGAGASASDLLVMGVNSTLYWHER